ncbi:hypothetical protein CDD81_3462 [Ophiocordyceps australis]|uniref:Peptidase A1 domain-containing protein n=1 Tax=Ophiocordyceps australis TaxID=1399860 RepID=A0A2C5YDL0_9HYPO|nr:hypothetical protein CDD81_3462 [Ophiocordyceps australis]
METSEQGPVIAEFSLGTPPEKLAVALDSDSAAPWAWSNEKLQRNLDANPSDAAFDLETSLRQLFSNHTARRVGGTLSVDFIDILLQDGGVAPLLDLLKEQGVVKQRIAGIAADKSFWDHSSATLGGIDTKKFSGPFKVPQPHTDPSCGLELNQVSIEPGIGIDSVYRGMLANHFGPGTHLDLAPRDLLSWIFEHWANVTTIKSDHHGRTWYSTSCSNINMRGSFAFSFGNSTVKVPSAHFVIAVEDKECFIPAWATYGCPFFRSSYVVINPVNNSVLIAKAADCGFNPIALAPGSNALSQIQGECPDDKQ